MGIITKTKTWIDNENVTFSDLNDNFDNVYNEVNGNIDNANIKASAGIEGSKLAPDVVLTTGTQAITGIKTLTGPIIAGSDNAAPTIAGKMEYNTTTNQILYGNGTQTITLGQQYRAFTWFLDGPYYVSTNKIGAKYVAPQNMTTLKVVYKTETTNSQIQLYKDATLIGQYEVGTSFGSTNVSTPITAGQIISLVVSGANGVPTNLSVTLECIQS